MKQPSHKTYPFARIRFKVIAGFTVCLVAASLVVNSANDVYVPEELQDWKEWVLHDHPHLDCPHMGLGSQRSSCAWVSSVKIEVSRQVDDTGATFYLNITAFADADVVLPHAPGVRAYDVRLNDQIAVVVGGTTRPSIVLDKGEHTVSGKLSWQVEPDSLTLPRRTGSVSLSIDGQRVSLPRFESPKLWFTPQTETVQSDVVEVKVFRRLIDSIPQTLDTYVHLSVGGPDRVIALGQVLPDGFEYSGLESSIPAQVNRQGNLTVQATRGNHQLKITSRATRDILAFTTTKTSDIWPLEELWGFEARPNHRVVSISGVPSVDLSLTNSPFQDVPGFIVTSQNVLELVEQQTTDVTASDGFFRVDRDLWLGFDGEHFVVEDRLSAELEQERRLTTHYTPGKIVDGQRARLITFFDGDDEPLPGVNATIRDEHLTATSLVPRSGAIFSTGWDVDVQELNATLHLPPGWRLIGAQGVDYAQGSWLEEWDLWDIFLVLLLIAISLRVSRTWWVALIGVAAIITYQDSAAPTIGWIVLIALRAIQERVPAQRVQFVLKSLYWLVFGAVAIVSLYFSVTHVRQAIYPQLEEQDPFPISSAIFSPTQERTEGDIEEVTVTASFIRRENFVEKARQTGVVAQPMYSEDSIRQTGPGTPSWEWNTAALTWYGPVKRDQKMSLILMSPWITRLVDAIAGILVLVIALYFLGSTQLKQLPLGKLQRFLPILLLFAFVPDVNANTPDPRILDELESRLSSDPDCLPDCASTESIEVILDENIVTVKARIHSLGTFAVPLPTVSLATSDLSVFANDKQIPITRTSQGTLVALLPEGISSVVISNGIDTANAFDIEFPMNPSRIVLVYDGWQATGIANGVLTGKGIQFSRTVVTEDTTQEELIQERATPYVKVERQIRFSLETEVISYVRRLAPIEGAFRVQVPLLPGEEVYETDGTVEDGSVIVDFDSEQDYVYWLSRMDTPTSLRLIAPDLSERVEVWTISGSDHWHWSSEGLSPVMSKTDGAEFLPRSGDSLTVELQKPLPVPGESSTIESVAATYSIGTRLLTGNLALRINATQGNEINVELPEGAQVQEIEVTVGRDTTEYPPSEDHLVTLPISPGESVYRVTWRLEHSLPWLFTSPEVKLQLPARNVDVQVEFQGNRWTVFLAGPLMGPAVLFWGVVIVILVIAIALSLLPNFPLSRTDAVILSLGATLSNVWMLLLVGAWFIAIWLRGRNSQRMLEMEEPYFQGLQVVLATLSTFALVALVITIPRALLGSPDMQIVGNDSTSSVFRWYTDHVTGYLPEVTVFSLPNWIYLFLMLAWSLWLAFAIIKWSIATWNVMNKPYLWSKASNEPTEKLPAAPEND